MGMGPFTFEIVLTFFVAAAVLYKYGNWYRHHILVTVAVLIAWYFSMLIVFVLPLDVSNTIYETCLHDARQAALEAASTRAQLPSTTMTLLSDTHTTPANAAQALHITAERLRPKREVVNRVLNTNDFRNAQVMKDNFEASIKGLQLSHSDMVEPQNPVFNAENAGVSVEQPIKPFKGSRKQPLPLPPPGYNDKDVLGAAVHTMLSGMNKSEDLFGGHNSGESESGSVNNINGNNNVPKENYIDVSDDINNEVGSTRIPIEGKNKKPVKGLKASSIPEDFNSNGDRNDNFHLDSIETGIVLDGSKKIKSSNDSDNSTTVEYHPAPVFTCREPWSRVKPGVFPTFWRIVYWTSQVLTWLVLPLMQSYTKAGEFTVWGKLRSALIDNAIYYGSYLLIVGILLLYIALRPDVYLDGSQLRAIAASASNTWGLFWLVLLLGYGLVEVPRGLWHAACPQFMLNQGYFRSAKLSHERAEAWDHLNDLLQSLHSVGSSMGSQHPLRAHLDTVEQRVPAELLDRMRRPGHGQDAPHADVPSEKALVRLHKQLLKSLQHHNRVETQWALMVERVLYLEDAQRNSCSHDTHFKHSTPRQRSALVQTLYTPTIEWVWVCRVRGWLLRCLSLMCVVVSAAVVWSELTFFHQRPTLSLFAILVNIAKSNYDYITIEVVSTLTMAYIALCAYSTLFAVRVLNLYYLAPHHQTDQYSLIFSGMMLCRLTPPMCLNFLSVIHMDSHVIAVHTQETHYTQIMGHMDVIAIISDGFNVYFPMLIVALCLATYYSLGSRLLSALGFQQFIGSDGLTTDLVDEGRTLINRESRKRQRQQETAARRREFTQRFGVGENTTSLYRSARQRAEELLRRPYRRDPNTEASQMELLTSTASSPHYSLDTTNSSPHSPPLPGSPHNSSSQYTTSTHYTADPTRYSTPSSEQYNTHYSNSAGYRDDPERGSDLMDESPTGGFGNDTGFSRTRPGRVDKGLFDDV